MSASPTVLEVLNKTADYFRRKGIENWRLDAQLLLGHVLNLGRMELYLKYDRPMTDDELDKSREFVRRRGNREPLQHIIGNVPFRQLDLKTDKRALVPRHETEWVAGTALKELERIAALRATPALRVLEIGVGSGAILLSLAKECPHAICCGTDISAPALELARENTARNGLEGRVDLRPGDRFNPFSDQVWDLVVSNPPYIPKKEIPSLPPEVRDFDPREALVGGEAGWEFAAGLIAEAFPKVLEGGGMVLEIGHDQAAKLTELGQQQGWSEIQVEKDLAGLDRCLILKK